MTPVSTDRAITSVLFLLDRWVPGGVRKHVSDLCEVFDERGIECMVAAWLPPDEQEPDSSVSFVNLPLYRDNHFKSLAGFTQSASMLHEVLTNRTIDILHIHARYLTPLAARVVRSTPTSRVFTTHNVFRNLRYLPWYPKHVICLNEAGKEDFLRNRLLPRNLEVTLIPNGIKVDDSNAAARPSAKPAQFAFVGRLEHWKGADLILQALAAMPDADVQVQFAGSGPEEEMLRALAHRLGVAEKVRFLGYVDNPAEVIDNSAALIVPSRSLEGFGYVILEAYARRRPVLASDLNVFDDTVQEGVTGYRFKSGDRDSLVSVMRQALSHPDHMRAMGEYGNAILRERFTLEGMATATLGVYEKAAEH